MDWQPLEPIKSNHRTAIILNRQMVDVLEFRGKVINGTAGKGRFFSAEDAENEALRREFMLRRDIITFFSSQKLDATEHINAAKAIDQQLKERGGHRS